MFDMSWGEVMVIGAVALVVIGPKDLPKALRTVGQMTAKVRRMATEFQTQFNDAMREAEFEEARKEFEGIRNTVTSPTTAFNPLQTIRSEIQGAIESPAAGSPPMPTQPDAPLAPASANLPEPVPGEPHATPADPTHVPTITLPVIAPPHDPVLPGDDPKASGGRAA